jgi:hypothetical protein
MKFRIWNRVVSISFRNVVIKGVRVVSFVVAWGRANVKA